MHVLTHDVLKGLVNPAAFDAYLEDSLRTYEASRVVQPTRNVVRLGESAVWLIMPVIDLSSNTMVVKMVSEYKDNPVKGLPKATGLTQLIEASTGRLLALIDSHYITGLRTSSLAGIATKILSREDSERLGVIGSGYEAKLIVDAVLRVRPGITKIHVYSRNKERREKFASYYSDHYDAQAAPDPNPIVANSDILVVATDSATPVLSGSAVKRGAHIVSIGTLPERRELDRETIARCSLLVADNVEGVLREAGDVIDALNAGLISAERVVELVDIVKGRLKVERRYGDITIYKSVGFGYLDVVAARYVYEAYLKSHKANPNS
ncbi:MAG: ornithine cyclodeaminase family protein [Thermoprotei archaeon]